MTTTIDVPNVGTFVLSTTLSSDELQPIFEEAWTGSHIWQSSLVLAQYFDPATTKSPEAPNPLVLELGSGTGLLGLVAAKRGCRVILSDQQKLVSLLEKNVQLNAADQHFAYPVQVVELNWANPDTFFREEGSTGLNWLLISDCVNPIYGSESIRHLAETILMIIARQEPTSDTRLQILMAYQSRGQDEAWVEFTSYFTPLRFSFQVCLETEEKIQIVRLMAH